MKQNYLIRSFILFLLVINFKVAYAQTSGPHAPEYTSFEPVDVTDMVNLATGDFTYSVPLLEIPGPEGGYPLSLSYHAGIQPLQEASWVGLGWTLNAGAITRTVNGYADDHLGVTRVVNTNVEETERNTFSVQYGIPGVGFGLQISDDSNLGIGVGFTNSIGLGIDLSDNVSVGIKGTASANTYGESNSGFGAGFNISGTENNIEFLSVGFNVSNNVTSTDIGIGNNLLNINFSSNNNKPSLSAVGFRINQVNNNASNVSSVSKSFSIPIPTQAGIFWLGYRYHRYWIDQNDYLDTYGIVNAENAYQQSGSINTSLDSYSLPEPGSVPNVSPKPDHQKGGNFPSYDSYSVNAQGLNGSIQPYVFENISLFRQTIEGELSFDKRNPYYGKVGYRFVNDFSNVADHKEGMAFNYNKDDFEFDGILAGKNGDLGYEDNELAGSKHVKYYTNLEIRNGEAVSDGLVVTYDYINHPILFQQMNISNQIGGFKIIKEDGVTYHYSLPVYSYGEEHKVSKVKDGAPDFRFERREPQPYAYQWLLTAVTGPDYVDRGAIGLDDADWGYWVGFSYEEYVDNFQWRNPAIGFHKDLDNETNVSSHGLKQIYYVDSIFTRTHVAKFHLSERLDGREVTNLWSGGFKTPYYTNPNYSECNTQCNDEYGTNFDGYSECMQYCMNPENNSDIGRPLLKLDKISLHKKSRDGTDLNNQNTLSGVELNYDYSLQPNTPNSFPNFSPENITSGKLTLKSIDFFGKQEVSVLPPFEFQYDLPREGITIEIFNDSSLFDTNNQLDLGDLITFSINSIDYYAVVTESELRDYKLQYLNSNNNDLSGLGSSGTLKTVYKTKNPPFDKDAYDKWNMFKSDYVQESFSEPGKKYTTEISAQSVDSWSLRQIKNPTGSNININYSSKTYQNSSIKVGALFNISNVSALTQQDEIKIEIAEEYDLRGLYQTGDSIYINSAFISNIIRTGPEEDTTIICNDYGASNLFEKYAERSHIVRDNFLVSKVENNYIVISDNELYEKLYIDNYPNNYEIACSNCFSDDLDDEGEFIPKFQVAESYPFFYLGIIISNENVINYGGGIKVDSISLLSSNYNTSTVYNFKGGQTSYVPFDLIKIDDSDGDFDLYNFECIENVNDNISDFKTSLYSSYNDFFSLAREIPSPGVLYKNVTVTEKVNGIKVPGKIEYEFQTFDSTMVQRIAPFSQIDDRSYTCTLPAREYVENYCSQVGQTLEDGEYEPCGISCFEALRQADLNESTEITVQNDQSVEYPMTLKNYSVQVGNLKVMRVYGKDDQLLSSQENVYLHDVFERGDEFDSALEEYFANQGKISQAFHEFRTFKNDNGNMEDILSFSQRIEYPNVMLGQRVTDYKRNIVSEQWNLAFDWFSGEVLKTISKNSYGSYFLNESKPAYHIGEYEDSLGLAMYGGKNMLTQLAAMDVFKVGIDNDTLPILSENIDKLGLLSAKRNIWSDQIPVLNEGLQEGIYRKKSTFSWNGQTELQADGTYPINDFEDNPFDYAVVENNSQWEKQNEVTLIDVYSHILEQKDINEQFAVAKKDPGQCKTTLSAANANYHEVTFSGTEYFEGNDFEENGVSRNQGNVSTSRSHTGEYSLLIPIGNEGFSYTMNANDVDFTKDYRASVWVYLPGDAESAAEMDRVSLYAEADGQIIAANSPVLQRQKSKSWYLLNLDIEIPEGTQELRIGTFNDAIRAVYMDDFRVHPINAPIVSYVYDPISDELTHILGKDNLYARFEYDAQGRLVRTYKEFFYPVDRTASEMVYNYAK